MHLRLRIPLRCVHLIRNLSILDNLLLILQRCWKLKCLIHLYEIKVLKLCLLVGWKWNLLGVESVWKLLQISLNELRLRKMLLVYSVCLAWSPWMAFTLLSPNFLSIYNISILIFLNASATLQNFNLKFKSSYLFIDLNVWRIFFHLVLT